ncbi:MAG: hypothetical protein ABJL67_13205, partial [Sulfitobacter sp.]
SCEGLGVKGGNIVPDGSGCKVSSALRRDDPTARVFFPLDIASGVESGLCEAKTHIKATGSGAE